jgi:hypothetical protein
VNSGTGTLSSDSSINRISIFNNKNTTQYDNHNQEAWMCTCFGDMWILNGGPSNPLIPISSYHQMKGRQAAETDGARMYVYRKQVCVVGRGCSSLVMSLMFSAEKTKMKWKNSWNNPRGLRSMAYIRMYCFELGYQSLCKFRFSVCRI